jgi:hypothetical protein
MRLNTYPVFNPATTFVVASENTVQTLTTAQRLGNLNVGALISVESGAGNSIRFGLGGAVPTTAGTLLGHIADADDVIRLEGWDEVRSFKFCSKIAGSPATLQITVMNQGVDYVPS